MSVKTNFDWECELAEDSMKELLNKLNTLLQNDECSNYNADFINKFRKVRNCIQEELGR